MRRLIGSNVRLAITAITLSSSSRWIHILIYFTASRVSKNSSQKFSRRRTNRRHESEEILLRTKTAQCLQSRNRLRSRCMAADADSDAGFSVPRNSKLGNPAGDNADCDWFSHCSHHRMGLRADAGGLEANGVRGRIVKEIGA